MRGLGGAVTELLFIIWTVACLVIGIIAGIAAAAAVIDKNK